MGEKTVQSIRVMPFALMMGVMSAIIGLIVGVIYAVVFGAIMSGISLPPDTTGFVNLSWLGVLFGVGAIIIMPILAFVGLDKRRSSRSSLQLSRPENWRN